MLWLRRLRHLTTCICLIYCCLCCISLSLSACAAILPSCDMSHVSQLSSTFAACAATCAVAGTTLQHDEQGSAAAWHGMSLH